MSMKMLIILLLSLLSLLSLALSSPSLIQSASDFFNFDYNRVDDFNSDIFRFFINPATPFLGVFLYLALSKPVFTYIRKTFNIHPKGPVLQNIVVLHSALLALYSGWTMYHTWNIVWNYMKGGAGLVGAVCDYKGQLWYDKGFSYHVLHFYISKYYEFFDTWIIILKGREPTLLQEFHHAGIVIFMWAAYVSSASLVLIVVTFNSFIHTIMYSYYVAAAYGFKSTLKQYLTIAQITQFLIGMTITIPTHFIKDCLSPSAKFVAIVTQGYTVALILLFVLFYKEAYKPKPKQLKE